jgi:hypothetical protein
MQAYADRATKSNTGSAWAWVIEIQMDEQTWKIVNAGESELDAELTYYAEKARFADRNLRIRKAQSAQIRVGQAA